MINDTCMCRDNDMMTYMSVNNGKPMSFVLWSKEVEKTRKIRLFHGPFLQNSTNSFLGPEWTNDTHLPTQSCLLICMLSYLLISKAHTYDNHFLRVA